MSRDSFRVLFYVLLALASLQMSSSAPGETQELGLVERSSLPAIPLAKKSQDDVAHKTLEPRVPEEREMFRKALSTRIDSEVHFPGDLRHNFMNDERDSPEERKSFALQSHEERQDDRATPEEYIRQKRLFISQGRDLPEQRESFAIKRHERKQDERANTEEYIRQKRLFISQGRDLPEERKSFALQSHEQKHNDRATPEEYIRQKRLFISQGRDLPEERKSFALQSHEQKHDDRATPEEYIRRKRLFISQGRDLPEERKSLPFQSHEQNLYDRATGLSEKPGTEITKKRRIAESAQAQVSDNYQRKRLFMTDEGDTPKTGQAFIPGRQDKLEISQEGSGDRRQWPEERPERPIDYSEKAGELKHLLGLRNRVSILHKKLDEAIDKYRSIDGNMGTGKEHIPK